MKLDGILWQFHVAKQIINRPTVDGRNPAPVDSWFIPLFIGIQPSKVVQDFFHPPYFNLTVHSHMLCDSGDVSWLA